MNNHPNSTAATEWSANQFKALLDIYRLSKVVSQHARYGVIGVSEDSQVHGLHSRACDSMEEAIIRFEKSVPTINIDNSEATHAE